MRLLPPAVAMLSLLLLPCTGAGGRADAAGPGPKVVALPTDRAAVTGTLQGLSAEALVLTEATGGVVTLPLAGLRDLRFPDAAPAAAPGERLRVTLVGGEELVAQRFEPRPDGLALMSPSFGTLEVSFEQLRALVPLAARSSACHDPLGRLGHTPGADHLHLTGGDEVHGTLVDASAQGLRIEIERDRVRTVAWSDVLLATLDNAPSAEPPGSVVEVETVAGDVLRTRGPLALDGGVLSFALLSHPGLAPRVPLSALAAVRWRGERCVDATRLAFRSTYTPLVTPPPGSLTEAFLARDRGCRVGRRPRGCPLRLGGTTYRRGFAVHAASEVRLPLEGRFRRFEALVGVDDEALEEAQGRDVVPGDVDLRVLGDGKVLWEAKGVTGGAPPRRVGPLEVAGVKELVLVVSFGGHDEILDRVTWADPVVLP